MKNPKVRIRENKSPTSRPGTQSYLKVRSFGLIEKVLGYCLHIISNSIDSSTTLLKFLPCLFQQLKHEDLAMVQFLQQVFHSHFSCLDIIIYQDFYNPLPQLHLEMSGLVLCILCMKIFISYK